VGSPKFIKTLFWVAVLVGAAFFGVHWLQDNPHAADLQKTQPGVYQPQPANQPGEKIVVVP